AVPSRMVHSEGGDRLELRHDTADLRLTDLGRQVGLVDEVRWARYRDRREALDRLRTLLTGTRVPGGTLFQVLRRPETTWEDLRCLAPTLDLGFADDVIDQATIEAKYDGYIRRQRDQIERF